MRQPTSALRCAIYTRVSSDHGLDQEFSSLDNQREAAEAYIKSQAHEGWRCQPERYDDGGFSGGSLDRPALQRLLTAVRERRFDIIVVYKVDRLTRSLADFAKLVELFDTHGVSFVSVTQAFNTTTSMGRLTLNVLLSFAQFEREVTGERIRDKIAASKKKGLWMGGVVPLGYRVEARKLVVDPQEAELVRSIFERYLQLGSVPALQRALRADGVSQVPVAVLVAIMVMVSVDTFNWSSVKAVVAHPRMSSTVMLATVAVTVVSHNLALGVLVGVLLSGVFFTFKVARLMQVRPEPDAATGRLTYHVTGQVFFASADAFIEAFDLGAHDETSVRIDVSQAHFWDVTAVAALDKVVGRYRANDIPVEVAGMNQATATIVDRLTIHDKRRPALSER